jgi:hypothetical protein
METSEFVSDTYDMLTRVELEGGWWRQYAVLGADNARETVSKAAKGVVMAVGNRGDKHYS